MSVRASFFTIVVIGLLMGAEARADSSAKRLIFDNCREAKAELSKLQAGEHDEFVAYLGRVLTMPTGSAADLLREPELSALFPSTPNLHTGQQPIDELKGISISRTLEPEREIEAKRCAAELLIEFGDSGLANVPTIVEMLGDQTLTEDFRHSLEGSVELMVKQGLARSSPALPGVVERAFQIAVTKESGPASRVIVLAGKAAVPFLVDQIFGKEDGPAVFADRLLQTIDGGRQEFLPVFEQKLSSSEPAIQDRTYRIIKQWKRVPPELLGELLERSLLRSVEKTDSSADLILRILQQSEPASEPFPLEGDVFGPYFALAAERASAAEPAIADATKAIELFTPGLFSGLERALRAREIIALRVLFRAMRSEETRASMNTLGSGLKGDMRAMFLPILAVLSPDSRETFELAVNGIRSEEDLTRAFAFDALGSAPAFAEEKAKALLQFTKSPRERRTEDRRRSGLLYALDVVTRLPDKPYRKSFLPFAVESVSWAPLPPATVFQLGSGKTEDRTRGGFVDFVATYPESFTAAFKKLFEEGTESQLVQLLEPLTKRELPARTRKILAPLAAVVGDRFPGTTAALDATLVFSDAVSAAAATEASPSPSAVAPSAPMPSPVATPVQSALVPPAPPSPQPSPSPTASHLPAPSGDAPGAATPAPAAPAA